MIEAFKITHDTYDSDVSLIIFSITDSIMICESTIFLHVSL